MTCREDAHGCRRWEVSLSSIKKMAVPVKNNMAVTGSPCFFKQHLKGGNQRSPACLHAGICGSNSTESRFVIGACRLSRVERELKNTITLALSVQFKAQNYPRDAGVYYPKKKTERKGAVLVRIPGKTSSHSQLFLRLGLHQGWLLLYVSENSGLKIIKKNVDRQTFQHLDSLLSVLLILALISHTFLPLLPHVC